MNQVGDIVLQNNCFLGKKYFGDFYVRSQYKLVGYLLLVSVIEEVKQKEKGLMIVVFRGKKKRVNVYDNLFVLYYCFIFKMYVSSKF